MMSTHGFGDRLYVAMKERGPVCVGIDPHPDLLEAWGLPSTVEGLRSFSMTVVDALADRVAAFKPQAAFFERFGSQGVAVLEEVIASCRAQGALCIVDAKRGDIGSTMEGYADAFLDGASALAGDAVTLSPYLGVGALAPAFDRAVAQGKGVFVLALTSNPQGKSIQHSRDDRGVSVAASVIEELGLFNAKCEFEHIGPCGAVIGATVGTAVQDLQIDCGQMRGIILAPGVGAQGAGPDQVKQVFSGVEDRVLASTSRAVLAAGPDGTELRKAHDKAVQELAKM